MLTVPFSKKPVGKNSSSVTGTSGSCSRRSIGGISCLLMSWTSPFLLNDEGSSFFLVSSYGGEVAMALGFTFLASGE